MGFFLLKSKIHIRFLSTLILYELINERPLDEISQQFGIKRGTIQMLQQQAASYSCNDPMIKIAFSHDRIFL